MAGRKSKVLFDSIDLQIIKELSKSHEGLGVLELAREMDLTHQNLKKHLEKLLRSNLVGTIKTISSTNKEDIGKITLTTSLSGINEDIIQDSPEDHKKLIKEQEKLSVLIKFLEEINNLDYPQETLKQIIKELEKNKARKRNN